MDPNATLAIIRELAHIIHGGQHPALAGDYETASRLAGAFQDLDEWLTRGGFLPTAWERRR